MLPHGHLVMKNPMIPEPVLRIKLIKINFKIYFNLNSLHLNL